MPSALVLGLLALALPGAAHADDPPFSDKTLGDRIRLEKTAVCTDGKSHYVVMAPHERQSHELFYGDGKTFHRVPLPPWVLSGENFLDPRFFNKTANSSFRGLDMRNFSEVTNAGGPGKACQVRCGDRTTDLGGVEPGKARTLLLGATFGAALRKREPYALARDQEGKYYYVDRGATTETQKNFRLFVGQKGSLKLQKMTDVVSDSEGEIFATKTGSLRLILGRSESTWIAGKKTTKLTLVPIEQNLQMIYNDLGVYTGERLGTPCDDL